MRARLIGGRFCRPAIVGYHLEAEMTDVLIRDVPEEVIAAIDARAARLGVSRSEYVWRPPGSGRRHTRFAGQCAESGAVHPQLR